MAMSPYEVRQYEYGRESGTQNAIMQNVRAYRWQVFIAVVLLFVAASAPAAQNDDDTFSRAEITQRVADAFAMNSENTGKAVEAVFERYGRPNAYILGDEGSAAIGVGLRYGKGTMIRKHGTNRTVYWQGPSLGFDLGANASKTFTLVYNLPKPDAIYQRFPGVEGSYYLVAGIGVNYQKSGNIVLAPMRAGVGMRTGVNVGYLSYSRERSLLPF